MNSQLSYEMTQCRTSDFMRAAEHRQMLDDAKGHGRRSRRFRWTRRAPRTAPLALLRARVA